MSTINVNKYQMAEVTLNEWEYEYVIDSLMYYQYHEKLNDSRLKQFINEIDLDKEVSAGMFQEKLKGYKHSEIP
jgi:hypothetical protein